MFKVMLTAILFLIIFLTIPLWAAEPIAPGNYYYTADWCPACQVQGKVIKQLQKQGYTIHVYNIGEGPIRDITKIPILIIVKVDEKGKQLILKLKGLQPIEKLIKLLQSDQTPGRS